MTKLWARVGFTIEVDSNQVEEFMQDQEAFIKKGIQEGTIEMDGETYFPGEVEANNSFEKIHGYLI